MRTSLDLGATPVALLVALGIVLVLEIALDVIALVDLVRRPVERVTLGNKWIWAAVIVLVNLIGAILYFAIGRRPAAAGGGAGAAKPSRSSAEIAEALYGDSDRTTTP